MEKNYDKFVVISGGSGGLGRATALYFQQKGFYVFSLDIKTTGENVENIMEIETDITNNESVENAFNKINLVTDKVDAVISLAGIHFMDSVIEVEEEKLKKIFEINFFGVYRLNKIFYPLIEKEKGRYVIITSELAGMKALPFNGMYSITKTALQNYTDALRQEANLHNIPVIEIMPGAFDTGMVEKSFDSIKSFSQNTKLYNTNIQKYINIMKTQSGSAKAPSILAKTVYKAVTKNKPRLQYKPNANFMLKFLNIFPRKMQVKIISKLIKSK